MKLIKSFVPHSRCFGSYFDVICLMYLVSSGFSFKPTSSCSSSSSKIKNQKSNRSIFVFMVAACMKVCSRQAGRKHLFDFLANRTNQLAYASRMCILDMTMTGTKGTWIKKENSNIRDIISGNMKSHKLYFHTFYAHACRLYYPAVMVQIQG